jgi:hypothetical protein
VFWVFNVEPNREATQDLRSQAYDASHILKKLASKQKPKLTSPTTRNVIAAPHVFAGILRTLFRAVIPTGSTSRSPCRGC